ncbi:MAG: phosphotransferase family protein [Polyangiaceae bacterium]|nr:phosphotransferase family protein [Polyangiaceae bacterium]
MTDLADRPRAVRSGEELDVGRLAGYLRGALPELADAADLTVEQFPSGHSNLTYLVRAGAREYVLRRPPFGSRVKTAHDMGREYRILSRLSAVYPKAPRPLVHCEDEGVMGAPFYLMRRLHGIILRKHPPAGFDTSPARIRAIHEALVDGLAELHAVDYAAAGLADLGKPVGYVERQVTGWTKRWEGSKTDPIESVEEAARWLAAHLPGESGAALVHNDFKLDNVVLDPDDPTRIVGVLDWEMSTLGDPLMDLGTTLSYWVEATDDESRQALLWGPTALPGSLTRRELAARYGERSQRDVSNAVYYYVFGLFKTAVVLQQIYYRDRQGLTKDERFAPLIFGVGVLGNAAVDAIGRGEL